MRSVLQRSIRYPQRYPVARFLGRTELYCVPLLRQLQGIFLRHLGLDSLEHFLRFQSETAQIYRISRVSLEQSTTGDWFGHNSQVTGCWSTVIVVRSILLVHKSRGSRRGFYVIHASRYGWHDPTTISQVLYSSVHTVKPTYFKPQKESVLVPQQFCAVLEQRPAGHQ